MKKIIFSNLIMKKHLNAFVYEVPGNKEIEYDKEVVFPINAVLAKSISKGDEVKVVLLKKNDIEGNSDLNERKFKSELDSINEGIGAKISYVTLTSPFDESKYVHERLMRQMVGQLEKGVEIYADITYGPKPLAIAMFSMLKFADKFFNADIKNIIYGKVDFITDTDGKTTPVNPVIFDVTPLYYLDSVTDKIPVCDSKEAVKALDLLLSI